MATKLPYAPNLRFGEGVSGGNPCSRVRAIASQEKQVEIYRPHVAVEVLNSPKILSGEDVLPDFVLDLKPIFS